MVIFISHSSKGCGMYCPNWDGAYKIALAAYQKE